MLSPPVPASWEIFQALVTRTVTAHGYRESLVATAFGKDFAEVLRACPLKKSPMALSFIEYFEY